MNADGVEGEGRRKESGVDGEKAEVCKYMEDKAP